MMPNRRDFLALAAMFVAAAPIPGLAQVASPAISPVDAIPKVEGSFQIPEQFHARIVAVHRDLLPNEIHILPQNTHLYYTLGNGQAIRYGVAVGREGLAYRGTAVVGNKVEWPNWRPTDEMIARNPGAYARYADGMPGGPNNPLGARAMYLHENGRDNSIRIHGTIEPASIGRAASNGCFRMYNSHVIDLYQRVALGTVVHAY